MRASLLAHDPQLGPVTMQTLMGIASAIEQEAVRRYTQLEQTMRQRGEFDTAEAFRRMLDEEREHVEVVRRLAADAGVEVPDAAAFEWTLPPDLAASWEAIAGSSLLTPYRAFAIAVENEQRAFAFYSYLAAHAVDRAVARLAERLAAEELRHAARVRQWRREAYHRERPHDDAFANARAAQATAHIAASPERLRAFLDERRAAIAARHRLIAARLRGLGDDSAASLLEAFAEAHGGGSDAPDPVGDDERALIARADDPLHLLVAAQKPLEKLGESLDQILLVSRDEAFALAERAATDVVAWLARVSLAVERRAHREPAA